KCRFSDASSDMAMIHIIRNILNIKKNFLSLVVAFNIGDYPFISKIQQQIEKFFCKIHTTKLKFPTKFAV
ncbi:MAG: hypothetical protein ACP5DZ_11155, partial [Bacteroidales bacterium]